MKRLAALTLTLLATTACGEAERAADAEAEMAEMAAAMAEVAAQASAFAPSDTERAEILATVQKIFDALAGDADLLVEIMGPDIVMRSVQVGEDGAPQWSSSTVEGLAGRIASSETLMTERMWDADVKVSGNLATVWTPYDFYVGSELSHCGVDVVTLQRSTEGWRIVSLNWNRQQPPDCRLHPDGPPGG